MERRVFSVCCAACLLVCSAVVAPLAISKRAFQLRPEGPSRFSTHPSGGTALLRDSHRSEVWFLEQSSDHDKPTWLPLTVNSGAPETVSWGREGPRAITGGLARPPRFALRSMLEQRGYTRIRVRRMPSGYMRIAGKFDSTDVALLVDSGSPQTLFDRDRAIALGLILRTKPDGPLENDQSARGVWGALEIGSIRTHELFIGFYDLGEINRATAKFNGEPPVDGILGGDVLGAHLAVVDYADDDLYLLARTRGD